MSTWPQLTGNSNVFRQTYVAGFLDISGPTTIRQDLTIMGRIVVPTIVNNNVVTNYSLIIAEDLSLNGRLYVGSGSGSKFLQGNAYMLDISGTNEQSGTVRIFEDKGTLPTATTGSLIIQHNDASGVSSILFPSKSNLGLDYASIAYYESISGGLSGASKYNYYGDIPSTTSSALVFNVQRDAFNATDVSSIDSIIMQAAGSIIIDACGGNTLGQTIIQPRGGNVGIGKTFPQYPLDIHGAANMSALSLNDGSVMVSSTPQLDFSNNFAVNWKPVGTSMPGSALQFNGLAFSATGQIQTAVVGNATPATTGSIYTSYNYGLTWNQSVQVAANWGGVAVSGNGQVQTAIVGGTGGVTSGNIFISTNYGNTWTASASAGSSTWTGIAMSENGIFQTAVSTTGVYISSNSGTTWVNPISIANLYCVSISANGKYQLAGIGGATATGTLYLSTDYGATWVNSNTGITPGIVNCHSVAVSATGQYMTALVFGGAIYTSSDFGVTWVKNNSAPTNINWHGVTMSSNGQYQLAVNNNAGFIYWSANYGSTWTQTASAQAWRTVAMSADAKYLAACVVGGAIYSSITPLPYLSVSGNMDVSGVIMSSGSVTATGNLYVTNGTSTAGFGLNGAVLTTGNVLSLTSGATSTNTSTGALQVTGGVGVTGNLNVGGTVTTFTGGNVGIGTTNPAYTLDINGNNRISGNLYMTGYPSILGCDYSTSTINSLVIPTYGLSWQNDTAFNNSGPTGFFSSWGGLKFQSGATTRMCINGTGNVGIATTSPQGALDVNGTFYCNTGVSIGTVVAAPGVGSGFKVHIKADTNGQNPLATYAYSDTNYIFACYNSASNYRGSIIGVNSTTIRYDTSSDRRLKGNIAPMPSVLDKIKKLQPRTYTWKESGDKDDGFVAQEVHKIFPQFMSSAVAYCNICNHSYSDLFEGKLCDCCDFENPIDKEGKPHYYGLDYGKFTPYLTKGLQEVIEIVETQQQEIKDLKEQNQELKTENTDLKSRLASIEARLAAAGF
jgi:hypothetical protein